jgi:hypothetical protein
MDEFEFHSKKQVLFDHPNLYIARLLFNYSTLRVESDAELVSCTLVS